MILENIKIDEKLEHILEETIGDQFEQKLIDSAKKGFDIQDLRTGLHILRGTVRSALFVAFQLGKEKNE